MLGDSCHLPFALEETCSLVITFKFQKRSPWEPEIIMCFLAAHLFAIGWFDGPMLWLMIQKYCIVKSYEDRSMLSILKCMGFQSLVKVLMWGVEPDGGLEGSWFPWRGGTKAVLVSTFFTLLTHFVLSRSYWREMACLLTAFHVVREKAILFLLSCLHYLVSPKFRQGKGQWWEALMGGLQMAWTITHDPTKPQPREAFFHSALYHRGRSGSIKFTL